MTDDELLALQAELDELERMNPAVRAAAESYDRMVERITERIAVAYDVPNEMVGLPDDGRRPDPEDQRHPDDQCYRCDHRRDQHRDGQCEGIWNGRPCPCEDFDEGDHWQGLGAVADALTQLTEDMGLYE